ncbi:MAG: type II secretion system protein [Phycisphaerales bacterium]
MNLRVFKESSNNSKARDCFVVFCVPMSQKTPRNDIFRDCLKFEKGYSLTELLILLAIIAVISIPISRLSNVVIFDIPKSLKLIEADKSVRNALSFMKQDADSALSISKTENGQIVIEQNGKTIIYLFQDDVISRTVKGSEGKIEWQIPNGKINWQVWEKQGRGYAVEVKKYIEHARDNGIEKKMENSFVFFAGDFKERTK